MLLTLTGACITLIIVNVLLMLRILSLRASTAAQSAARSTAQSTAQSARDEPIKAILLLRTDLEMQKGKAVAQAMHAAYAAGYHAQNTPLEKEWAKYGFKKVALRVGSEDEMKELVSQFKKRDIPVYPVVDAGRTQVAPNTWTVTMVGPYYESDIDQVTGHLRLA
ncbi:peptidyl-tRNA hydrolase, PTH2 family [Nematocida displodere]|uniref:peptidyl-tRNA hydrolase n=1 Tax=Nematocida displodere TaxID=1805483 RepID=A0A177EIY5_9MICR|nr:peptidyl-tRNA hydrolase, PTH2 family [Nematocida displodere]